mgnify:CR=1 FL=1
MSSCISFTTGPIFAGLLAFILINEKLNFREVVAILSGIIGTSMLIMPQWYLFLGLGTNEIKERLSADTKTNKFYYVGICLALFSAAMDTCTYFIIRKIGTTIPKAIIPFIGGCITTFYMFVYISYTDPLDFGFYFKHDPSAEDLKYRNAIFLAFIGALCAWVAFECMIIGLQISKSALASYGEMTGITVPFLFDIFYFGRKFLTIDAMGLSLIVVLQVYNAIKKQKEAAEEANKKVLVEATEMETEETPAADDAERIAI